MRGLPQTIALVSLLALFGPACGGGQPPSGGVQTITGHERLFWDQQAPDAVELSHYSFVLYVDGAPNVLGNATCNELGGDGPSAACSSSLPAIGPGQHTLELATRLNQAGALLESARSSPLIVIVAGAAGAASAGAVGPIALGAPASRAVPAGEAAEAGEITVPSGAPYVIERVASGLDGAVALARLPDGRLLVAESRKNQSGSSFPRVRVVEGGRLLERPALELPDADPSAEEGWSLAVAPDFAATRQVYVGYVALDRENQSGTGFPRVGRVVRCREAGGVLVRTAVVLDGLPAQSGVLRVKVGFDGLLYVGTGAVDPREADDLGSYAGKILRFAAGGATAAGNPFKFSPVFSYGYRGRPGFDWEPVTGALWAAETDGSGTSLRRVSPGQPAAETLHLDGVSGSAIAFHRGSTPAAWRNGLFIASPGDRCLYRVSGLSASPPEARVERLLDTGFSRITAVLSADDGLYLATANGQMADSGETAGALFRVRDQNASSGGAGPVESRILRLEKTAASNTSK